MAMSVFITRSRKQPASGPSYEFLELRENYYDKTVKGVRQRYIGYLGRRAVLTASQAKRICRRRGLRMEQLRRVKGLKLVPDEA